MTFCNKGVVRAGNWPISSSQMSVLAGFMTGGHSLDAIQTKVRQWIFVIINDCSLMMSYTLEELYCIYKILKVLLQTQLKWFWLNLHHSICFINIIGHKDDSLLTPLSAQNWNMGHGTEIWCPCPNSAIRMIICVSPFSSQGGQSNLGSVCSIQSSPCQGCQVWPSATEMEAFCSPHRSKVCFQTNIFNHSDHEILHITVI